MSDDGEKTCPLCAEDMDLTDQQLKPCKCGYEICVWCWHQIMDMAEKENSEGRCPACRTPYDKERIVGMAADCKRMVTEISVEKKHKSQKTKTKTSATEDRKHLSNVRVVQRNLVYIMGMPSNLADESILEHKEYFGQYGKILKVSMSKQAGTTTQQASNNNTCSVYITFSREEEAVRCIQAVHNFILEGKPLRACFGTTKYCYAWLRNTTCSNPDCLYLHDIGSQEDSFTKDEIISAYTRSRVPQVASNNLQPRGGNVLPPPADDGCSNGAVSAKQHGLKSVPNNTATLVKALGNDTSRSRSIGLPAAASWGSNCRSPASSMVCSQGILKQKPELPSSSSGSCSMISSTEVTSAWHDDVVTTSKIPEGRHTVHKDGRSRPLEPLKPGSEKNCPTEISGGSSDTVLDSGHALGLAWDDDLSVSRTLEGTLAVQIDGTDTLRAATARNHPSIVCDEERVLGETHYSAWDDDTVTTSKVPERRQSLDVEDRVGSLDTSGAGTGLARMSAKDFSSKAVPIAACTSGASISRSSNPLVAASENTDGGINISLVNENRVNSTGSEGLYDQSKCHPDDFTHGSAGVNRNVEGLCLGLSSVNLNGHLVAGHPNMSQHQSLGGDSHFADTLDNLDLKLKQYYSEHGVECLNSVPISKVSATPDAHGSGELPDSRSKLQNQVFSSATNVVESALVATDGHRQRLLGVTDQASLLSYKNCPLKNSDYLLNSYQNGNVSGKQFPVDGNSRSIGTEIDKGLSRHHESIHLFGRMEEMRGSSGKLGRNFDYSEVNRSEKDLKYSGSFVDVNNNDKTAIVDMGEESIVSDILSMDFDPWDDSWSSANNFARFLGQTAKQEGPSKLPSLSKSQNSNQSRFSFARQENQTNFEESSCRDNAQTERLFSLKQESYGNHFENTPPINNREGSYVTMSSDAAISSDKSAGVARAKVSAPPGFSVPNRPPPGFSSQDRYDLSYDKQSTSSENRLLGSPSQNQFHIHSAVDAGDVEFIDPAILAVSKGRLPIGVTNAGLGLTSFPSQFGISESDSRIQLLMQQPISANKDPRISNHIGERSLPSSDAYISSRLSVQTPSSISPFAKISHQQPSHILNGHWDSWNDVPRSNGVGIAEILRNGRFGLNNYFPVNEEQRFHIPGPGDLYNRAFGM